MKTDKELLELAEKAAKSANKDILTIGCPLVDDGDAFRLAVELSIDLQVYSKNVEACAWFDGELIDSFKERYSNNKLEATRRAIVRAAAAIGERL